MARSVVEMARRASGRAQKRARTMVQVRFQRRPARRERMAIFMDVDGELAVGVVVGCGESDGCICLEVLHNERIPVLNRVDRYVQLYVRCRILPITVVSAHFSFSRYC